MLNVLQDGPALKLTASITLSKDSLSKYPLPKIKKERVTTYVVAVNYFLKSYATESNIVNATFEISALRKAENETIAQFVGVQRTKVLRCENACPEEKTKSIFIEGLPANI